MSNPVLDPLAEAARTEAAEETARRLVAELAAKQAWIDALKENLQTDQETIRATAEAVAIKEAATLKLQQQLLAKQLDIERLEKAIVDNRRTLTTSNTANSSREDAK